MSHNRGGELFYVKCSHDTRLHCIILGHSDQEVNIAPQPQLAWWLETIYFMSAIAPATEQIQLPITSHAVMQPTVKQSPGPQSVVSRVVWSDYEL